MSNSYHFTSERTLDATTLSGSGGDLVDGATAGTNSMQSVGLLPYFIESPLAYLMCAGFRLIFQDHNIDLAVLA